MLGRKGLIDQRIESITSIDWLIDWLTGWLTNQMTDQPISQGFTVNSPTDQLADV